MNYNIRLFAENVKYIVGRTDEDITDFEKRVGVSRGYISRVARGTINPGASFLIRVADALALYIDDIFFYDRSADELEDLKTEEELLKERLEQIRADISEREKR